MAFFKQFPKINYDFNLDSINTTITDLFRFIKIDDNLFDEIGVYEIYNISAGDRPDVVSNLLYGTPEYYWTFFLCNDDLKNGLSSWPMNQTEFENYINLEYEGVVIQTRPFIPVTGDNLITGFPNSLADRFNNFDKFDVKTRTYQEGEQVTGQTSRATGFLKAKNVQLSQLILRNVEGNFIADPEASGLNFKSEQIKGVSSQDIVDSYLVYSYQNAPHHFETSDGRESYTSGTIEETANADEVLPVNMTLVSNLEYETRLNEERSRIRVISPKAIYRFAQTYKKLLNG